MFIRLTRQEGHARVPTFVNTDQITMMARYTDEESPYTLISFVGGYSAPVTETPEEIIEDITRREEHQLRHQGLLPGNRPGQ